MGEGTVLAPAPVTTSQDNSWHLLLPSRQLTVVFGPLNPDDLCQ